MGYSSEWGKNAAQGGPFAAGKKNPRPQNYVGNYSQPKATGPIVNQGFRKELPAAKNSDVLDGQYDGNAVTDAPTFEDVSAKWGGGRYKGGL